MTTCTSASVVILESCASHLADVRTNLGLIQPGDWMEDELMEQAQEHLNALNTAVRGLADHRRKGAKAQ